MTLAKPLKIPPAMAKEDYFLVGQSPLKRNKQALYYRLT